MTSAIQIFNQIEDIKPIDKQNKNTYMGFCYVLDCSKGVKIGSAKDPYKRLMSLKKNIETYGHGTIKRIALTPKHTNFRKNEKFLHAHFGPKRIPKTELFELDFESAVSAISDLNLEYKDETVEIERKADTFLDMMKGVLEWESPEVK